MSDSAIEAVAGTGGIAAAVDTLWQLKRKPEGEATLDVVGRETEERTLAMRFDREPFGWRILGDDDAQLLNSERRQVLDLLREDGALSPAQMAAELGKSRPCRPNAAETQEGRPPGQKTRFQVRSHTLCELQRYRE
jgi:hypothetical protein